MTRRFFAALVAFAGLGVAASAATQTQAAARQTTAPPMVAVIGCVSPVLPAAPSGTGAKPAPPPAAFRLTETQPGGGSPVVGSTGGARPATPPPPPQRGATTPTIEPEYWLAAVPSIDLKVHTNHRVEVTGTVTAVKPTVPPPPQPGAKPAPPPKTLLTITELKMISSECK